MQFLKMENVKVCQLLIPLNSKDMKLTSFFPASELPPVIQQIFYFSGEITSKYETKISELKRYLCEQDQSYFNYLYENVSIIKEHFSPNVKLS